MACFKNEQEVQQRESWLRERDLLVLEVVFQDVLIVLPQSTRVLKSGEIDRWLSLTESFRKEKTIR